MSPSEAPTKTPISSLLTPTPLPLTTQARKRRYVLPEVLQHLLPGIRPPSASYLARVAAAHAAAVQAGA